jgi:hypothetical protein
MIKKAILLLFVFAGFISNAQEKVSYTYYFNDPTNLSKKRVYLDILSFEGAKIGAGLHGYYTPIKKLTVSGLFRYNYLDYFTKTDAKDKVSTNDLKGSYTGEAGVTFQFAGYIAKKQRKMPILIAGNSTSKTSIRVPVKKSRTFGVRGGVMMYRGTIKNSNAFPFVSNGIEIDSTKKIFTNATSTCFYFGYTGRKVRKAGIDAEGYGKRRAYLSRVFFADVITGATFLSDVQYAGQTWKLKDSKTDALGFRLGWEWDENGTTTRVEMGKRPGFKGSIFPVNYFMLSFGFSIYGNEKFVEKTEK